MKFNLLIKGGHVVDPASGRDGPADVAISRGRIAAVDSGIPVESAAEVFDAAGRHVTPGLVDMHTHIYRGATFWGVDPDPIASRTGVTTWVDAGSSGAFTVDGFREFIAEPAKVGVRAFLNISSIGLAAHDHELTNLAYCDPRLFEIMVDANRDLLVGGKVRLGASTVGDTGYESLTRAVEALERCDLPVMLHIAQPPPEPEEFADLLRPGDVVTHCFTGQGMRLVDDSGRVRDFAKRWVDRGVLFDIGHGTGSFTYASAEALLEAGVRPHFISSDVHQNSIDGPMYDLPTCLGKLMALGMTVSEVVACATINPARFLGMEREVGSLAQGSRADVAVYELIERDVPLYDSGWEVRTAASQLEHVATFLGGRLMPHVADRPRPRYLEWRRAGRDDALYARQDEVRRAHPRAVGRVAETVGR